MAANNSTHPRKRKTDAWLPYPEFPLSPHVATDRWYKTVRGRRHYFGKLADWQGALAKWQEQRDDIMAGRTPGGDTCQTLGDLRDTWLTAQLQRVEAGLLKPTTFNAFRNITKHARDVLGAHARVDQLRPADFGKLAAAIARDMAPSSARKAITVVRMLFTWAFESEVIEHAPRYGPDFKAPAKVAQRQAMKAKGRRDYSAAEVRAIFYAADVPLRAMVCLAINGGLTQRELSELLLSEVDLDAGWVRTSRGKTGEAREVPLWPETVAALRDAMEARPTPKTPDAADLFFVTRTGQAWVRESLRDDDQKLSRSDAINLLFRRLCVRLGTTIPGGAFGKLRHTFRTVADNAGDLNATLRVMGHGVPGISAHYVNRIDPARLRLVTDHVHRWLFPRPDFSPVE
jgi:integrase